MTENIQISIEIVHFEVSFMPYENEWLRTAVSGREQMAMGCNPQLSVRKLVSRLSFFDSIMNRQGDTWYVSALTAQNMCVMRIQGEGQSKVLSFHQDYY